MTLFTKIALHHDYAELLRKSAIRRGECVDCGKATCVCSKKTADVDPNIRQSVDDAKPNGLDAQQPLLRNPYALGENSDPQGKDFENGYQFAQSLGHMTLGQAQPQQIQSWASRSMPWRSGFAEAARGMGCGRIADQMKNTPNKIASCLPRLPGLDAKTAALPSHFGVPSNQHALAYPVAAAMGGSRAINRSVGQGMGIAVPAAIAALLPSEAVLPAIATTTAGKMGYGAAENMYNMNREIARGKRVFGQPKQANDVGSATNAAPSEFDQAISTPRSRNYLQGGVGSGLGSDAALAGSGVKLDELDPAGLEKMRHRGRALEAVGAIGLGALGGAGLAAYHHPINDWFDHGHTGETLKDLGVGATVGSAIGGYGLPAVAGYSSTNKLIEEAKRRRATGNQAPDMPASGPVHAGANAGHSEGGAGSEMTTSAM